MLGDVGTASKCAKSNYVSLVKCSVNALCGMVFGFALHKANVLHPKVIRRQLMFVEFTVVKFFLAALSTSMFTMSLVSMLPQAATAFNAATATYFRQMHERSFGTRVAGDVLLGVGIALARSCPVTLFAQLGALTTNSGPVLLGVMVAVLFIYFLKSYLNFFPKSQPVKSKNLFSHTPYFVLSIPIVAMFGILVCAFETLLPFEVDSLVKPREHEAENLLRSHPWPPYVCGIAVGILQAPMIAATGRTLSGWEGWEGGRWTDSWSQLLFVCGTALGGMASAHASGSWGFGGKTSPGKAFLGGFLMTLGAKVGKGCILYHGLTGMSLLSIQSFLSILVVFVSGCASAFLL